MADLAGGTWDIGIYSGSETIGAESGATLVYKKRARDSNGAAPPPPASYVYWNASNPGDAYPSPPPFGGPLVEETVLEIVES